MACTIENRNYITLLRIVCLWGFAVSSLPVAAQSDTEDEVTRLQSVVVGEQDSEPESELPLGTGISGDTLKSTAGSAGDPLRTVQALPGMAYVDDGSAEPAVRGSSPADNYVEADFAPVGYLFHAGGIISVFNSELVESFDIYSSAYGPEFYGVTGGVFDVRLRDPRSDRFQTTLDINFLQSGLLFEGPIAENQSFYLAGRFSYLDLFVEDQVEEEDGVSIEQFPKYSDYQGKYVWHINAGSTLRFQANGATDDLDLNIAEDSKEIDNEPIVAGRHFDKTQFHQQSINWDFDLGSGQVKSIVSHDNSSSEQLFGGAGNSTVTTDVWLLKSHATVPLSENYDIKFGASMTDVKADIEFAFNDPGCTEFEPGCTFSNAERLETKEKLDVKLGHAFLKNQLYVTDKLTLFPGLSMQTDDLLDEQFVEPRFALEYAWRDDLVFSAAVGQYHQIPALEQVNAVFGNPELEHIESNQAVVSVNKKFSSGWDVKTEIYYKQLANLVSGDPQQRYVNSGEGRAYGWDTLARKRLTDRLSGWVSLSLSEATRTNQETGESFAFAYDQPFNMSLVADYKLNSRWTLGAKFWTRSGAVYTPIVGATADADVDGLYNPEYGEINSARLPTYTRLDLRIDRTTIRANGKKISFYFELLNALNSKNVAGFDYNADYTAKEKEYQLPTIFGFGVKAEI